MAVTTPVAGFTDATAGADDDQTNELGCVESETPFWSRATALNRTVSPKEENETSAGVTAIDAIVARRTTATGVPTDPPPDVIVTGCGYGSFRSTVSPAALMSRKYRRKSSLEDVSGTRSDTSMVSAVAGIAMTVSRTAAPDGCAIVTRMRSKSIWLAALFSNAGIKASRPLMRPGPSASVQLRPNTPTSSTPARHNQRAARARGRLTAPTR